MRGCLTSLLGCLTSMLRCLTSVLGCLTSVRGCLTSVARRPALPWPLTFLRLLAPNHGHVVALLRRASTNAAPPDSLATPWRRHQRQMERHPW